ncbi:NAD(P)H-dependent oxidoreductase [candidate division KSB1 bacterium]|nr:NAD(P)H-dependent oxidoreductase [candidate division KSB1 bacterium]
MLRIATIAGSLRMGSYNRMLIELAEGYLEQTDVEIDRLDLRDFPLPVYDGDIEEKHGLPQAAWTLKARLAAAHGVLIAAPEYNHGMSGMFKNMIDWTSRGNSNPWESKVISLMGATDGPWGTLRAMPQYRQTFLSLGALLHPQFLSVPYANKVWQADGEMVDQTVAPRVEKHVRRFVDLTRRLRIA